MMGLAALLLLAGWQQDGSLERMRECIERWKGDDASAREAAVAKVVEAWKEWSEEALRALEEAGKSPDPDVGHRAKEALKRIKLRRTLGQEVLEAVPPIEGAFQDRDEGTRFEALQTLWRKRAEVGESGMNRVVEAAVREGWRFERREFYVWVGEEKAAPLAKLLIAMLRDPTPDVRSSAALAIGILGAKQYAGEIVPLLRDRDAEVRRSAAKTLDSLKAKEHSAAIVPLLRDPEVGVRMSATWALCGLGAKEHATAIVPLLKDPFDLLRVSAAQVLGILEAKEHAGLILPLLMDLEGQVRCAAAESLADLGTKEHSAAILPLLKDPEPDVRIAAAEALGTLGVKEHAAAILPLLKEPDAHGRKSAISALCRLGATEHSAAILPLLKDPQPYVRIAAAEALGTLGVKEHAAAILPLLKDPEAEVRVSAAAALCSLGAKEHAGEIVPLLKDPKADVRGSAAWALCSLDAKEYAPKLAPLLKDPETKVSVIRALGRLAPSESKIDFSKLEKEDSSEEVKLIASIALIRLGAKDRPEQLQILQKERRINLGLEHDLLLALAEAHEAGAPKLLEVELGRVESAEDLSKSLQREGWKLVGSDKYENPPWALGTFRNFLYEFRLAPLFEGKSVKIVSVEEALHYWEKRLSQE
jgi:HEAT repeat protein